MTCGIRVDHRERAWGWCRKWGVPYPCRRVTDTTGFEYAFSALRFVPSVNPFVEKREGCCEGRAYGWSRWVLWSGPKSPAWVDRNPPVTLVFGQKLDPAGSCGAVAVA